MCVCVCVCVCVCKYLDVTRYHSPPVLCCQRGGDQPQPVSKDTWHYEDDYSQTVNIQRGHEHTRTGN